MFNPDAIATLKVRNEVFLLTANEGDARVYPTGDEVIPGFERRRHLQRGSQRRRTSISTPTDFPAPPHCRNRPTSAG